MTTTMSVGLFSALTSLVLVLVLPASAVVLISPELHHGKTAVRYDAAQPPAIATNCSDPSEERTSECVSSNIDCWSLYIDNSSVILSCTSFTAANSTLSSPSSDCCSTVRSAWQLWPRRCFCNYIYFQYVTERRHTLPTLCNVTDSLCQICSSLNPPDAAVASCGGEIVPGASSKHKVKALTVALALVTAALLIGIIVVTTWLACSCCKKKPNAKVPDSTQDLYVDRTF